MTLPHAPAPYKWYDENWKYREELIINCDKVSGVLTNFPVLITEANVPPDLWAQAQPDGSDILFTLDDGQTALCHEIEEYNTNTQHLAIWMKFPHLDQFGALFHMYYGNSGASGLEDATNVWAYAYHGVWHLHQNPTNTAPQIGDSTDYGNDGTCQGGMNDGNLVAGQVAGCIDFDGTDDWIEVADDDSLDGFTNMTLVFWINADKIEDQFPFTKGISSTAGTCSWNVFLRSSGRLYFDVSDGSAKDSFFAGYGVYDTNEWRQIALVWTGSQQVLYRNGTYVCSVPATIETMTNYPATLRIGKRSSYEIDARLDEIRLSNVARSEAWVKTSYNNQKDPGSFVTRVCHSHVDDRTLQIVSAHGAPLPGVGSHTNDCGTVVTNTVTSPDTHATTQYVCTGWSVAGNTDTNGLASGTNSAMVMTLTNNAVLTWYWYTNYWLDTETNGCGAVDTEDQWVPQGSNMTIEATACSNWHFAGWSGDTNGCSFGSPITAPMTQARRITANFQMDVETHTLEIISAYGIPEPGVGVHTNDHGSFLTNTVTGTDTQGTTRYACTGWSVTGNADTNGLTSGSGTNMVMIHTNDAVLTWGWKKQYQVQTEAAANGSVYPEDAWGDEGSNLVVWAGADEGFGFIEWSGSGTSAIVAGGLHSVTVTVSVTGPVSLLMAHFGNAVPYAEGFESYAPGTALPGTNAWYAEEADAVVVSTDASAIQGLAGYTKACGYPLNTNHAQVAHINSTATNRVAGSASALWVDKMIRMDRRSLSSRPEIRSGAQVAAYPDTNGHLVLWHHSRETGSNVWTELEHDPILQGRWYRMTFRIDYETIDPTYSNRYCEVRLDGHLLTSPAAYTANDGSGSAGGSWFALAKMSIPTRMSSVVFYGEDYYIEDLVVTTSDPFPTHALEVISAYGSPVPSTGSHVYAENSVLTNTVTSPDTRGTTQYVCTGWSVVGNTDTNGLAGGSDTNMVMIHTNNAVLTWYWYTNYWLATTNAGRGSVNPQSDWQSSGSNVAVGASAQQYYHFVNWTRSGTNFIVVGDVNAATVTVVIMTAMELAAHFAENLACKRTPEWWLALHLLTNDSVGFCGAETNDADGDGTPSYEEWAADTIPTSKHSVLVVTGIGPTNGGMRVDWKGGTQAWQFLECRHSLFSTVEQWNAILTNRPLTAPATNYVDTNEPITTRFYRIRAIRE